MTDAPVILGLNDMTQTAEREGWSKTGGRTITEIWEGPLPQAQILARNERQAGDYDEISLSNTPGTNHATVELTLQLVDDTTEETWEVDTQEFFENIRSHPYFIPSGSIHEEVLAVDKIIDNGEYFDASDYTWENQLNRYYGLRMAGVEGYFSGYIVIRRRQRVSNQADVVLDYTTQNRVVTLDQISPPEKILGALNKMPVLTGYDGGDIASPQIVDQDYEWLKKPPKATIDEGGRRYEIIQEWWGAEAWSRVFYGGSWDPSPV
jgi:hypothetical protein